MSKDDAVPLPWLPPRPKESHKGDFGHALLVGGSRGMSGAIALSALAALRSGAGLVTVGVPSPCVDTVASFEPSYMTLPLPADSGGYISVAAREQIADFSDRVDCVACGPGIGRTSQLRDLVAWMYEVVPHPMVIDADGLYVLSERIERLDPPAGPRILTPHPGEFSRFVENAQLSRERLEQLAQHLAGSRGLIILLKGPRTMITDGKRVYHNTTGNPGMATGGSGDVLTGIIAALICQGLAPLDATRLAAHAHGLAGDRAAAKLGQTSMIASDLIRFLPEVFLSLER